MKKTFTEIANGLKQALTPINEMSLAWDYRKKNKAYCAWTEGPMSAENRYFKFYNSDSPDMASMVARIRIDRPEYVGGNHKESNSQGKVEKWILTPANKKLLIQLLNSPSDDNDNCTKWQDILIRWNRDNFGVPAKKTIANDFTGYQAKPGLMTGLQPFPIDYPMPDYMKLGE